MRSDLFFMMSMLGSTMWLLTLLIVVFYIVFACYRDRITNPRLAYWAYYSLSAGLLLPSVSALLPLFGESGAMAAMLTMILAPLGLFVGMVLLIWSVLPNSRSHLSIQFADTAAPQRGAATPVAMAPAPIAKTEEPS